jgi:hypothetical protein
MGKRKNLTSLSGFIAGRRPNILPDSHYLQNIYHPLSGSKQSIVSQEADKLIDMILKIHPIYAAHPSSICQLGLRNGY